MKYTLKMAQPLEIKAIAMPFFSVIIPTYNREGMISDAIRSVKAQTFTDFEIIVVDDGSTDQTKDRVLKEGEGIQYYKKGNAGVASARNTGLALASGEFICYLDSDDIWPRDKLSDYYNAIVSVPDIQVLFSDFVKHDYLKKVTYSVSNSQMFEIIYSLGKVDKGIRSFPKESSTRLLLHGYPIYPSTLCVRKSVHQQYLWDPGVLKSEDFNFMLKIVQSYRIHYIDKICCTVRVHDNNKSSDFVSKNTTIINTMKAVKNLYIEKENHWIYNHYISKKHLSNFRHYRKERLYKLYTKELFYALCYRSVWKKILFILLFKRRDNDI